MFDNAAVVVDVDGTVASRSGRGPYDEGRVGEDLPNIPVVVAVKALHAAGHPLIFVTGRRERSRLQTAIWLRTHVAEEFDLLMRPNFDLRSDAEVKADFRTRILENRVILLVFDDRDSTVAMWRAAGDTCLQVASGSF